MSKWYDKPTKLLSISKDIDYVMCIDENGSSNNLTYVLKQISNDKAFLIFEDKIVGYPSYKNKGIKIFP